MPQFSYLYVSKYLDRTHGRPDGVIDHSKDFMGLGWRHIGCRTNMRVETSKNKAVDHDYTITNVPCQDCVVQDIIHAGRQSRKIGTSCIYRGHGSLQYPLHQQHFLELDPFNPQKSIQHKDGKFA